MRCPACRFRFFRCLSCRLGADLVARLKQLWTPVEHRPAYKLPERTIAQRVNDIIGEQCGVSDEEIAAASTLEELGSADSLEAMEICIALEEEFDIEISDEEFERLHSLQELRDFVEAFTLTAFTG